MEDVLLDSAEFDRVFGLLVKFSSESPRRVYCNFLLQIL